MLEEPTCPGEYREKVGRVLALATVKRLEDKYGKASAAPVGALAEAVSSAGLQRSMRLAMRITRRSASPR